MDHQTNRPASQSIAFEGGINDIAQGAMRDAVALQAEARRMLADQACGGPSDCFLGRLSLSGSIS